MDVVTWAAILVLGPGALLVFAWFLRDLRQLFDGADEGPSRPGEGQ